MRKLNALAAAGLFVLILSTALVVSAAYQHAGDADKDPKFFLNIYPEKASTKLDNCALCHTGGAVTSSTGKTTTYGSCQWCHLKYGYTAPHGDITETLNSYGIAYKNSGRTEAALKTIESLDSDGDGYSNIEEINAIRYPGDAKDDPSKVVAPFRIYTKEQLLAMPQHRQFMLMNTTKSGDYYVEYSGVVLEDLLGRVGISPTASQVFAYAPDGYNQRHPLEDTSDNIGKNYAPFVKGTYPQANYFYGAVADKAINTDPVYPGWCDYSSPGNPGRQNGDPIIVDNSLRLILALKADGKDLVPGVLGPDNKLTTTSEGPFRVVSPQKVVGPPDQPSTNFTQDLIWPYDVNADHNAGFATKCTTIIKVEPLPAGTTDIDTMEAGWGYIDQNKIVIYGALQGPTLTSPANGASNVPWKPATLIWTEVADTDPAAKVTYTIEISKDQKTWTTFATQVASTEKSMKTLFAQSGNCKFLFFGLFGVIAVGASRRGKKFLGILFLIAATSAVISSCGGGSGSSGSNSSNTLSASATLDPATTYYWRVTADGPNSHLVSSVSSFTTRK